MPKEQVRDWALGNLVPLVESGLKLKRNNDRGRSLFAAARCASCHRFGNEGGGAGPDLTGVANRFNPRDLIEAIVSPSKVISDEYGALTFVTSDGRVVTGRIANLNGDSISIVTNMQDPGKMTNVDRRLIVEMRPSPVSMMPQGLLNSLRPDEILDLVAYLLSGDDRDVKTCR